VHDEDVVTSRFLARMLVMGAAPAAASGGQRGRPGVADTGTPGLFMAGDWVGPDGLLADTALASGQSAALAALHHCGRSATMVA
jgi:thioredoxin reductase